MTQLVQALKDEPLLHVDETTVSLSGTLRYVHVCVTDQLAYYFHGSRSSETIESGGVLGDYAGTVVSDAYTGYNMMSKDAKRQLCWAHLIRELERHVITFNKAKIEQPYPQLLLDEARLILHHKDDSVQRTPDQFRKILKATREQLVLDTQLNRDLNRILSRLENRDADLWTFLDRVTPPTNNLAEQSIRGLKVKERRSGAYQSKHGLAVRLVLRSCLETMKRLGCDTHEAVKYLLENKALMRVKA